MTEQTLYDESKDQLSSAEYTLDSLGSGGFCRESAETRAANRFGGKTIVITGAAGNFGANCAERMAAEGANCILWDLRSSQSVADALAAKYPDQKFLSDEVDVTNAEIVAAATQRAVELTGRIDMLFNNAGYQGSFSPCKDYTVDDFRKVLDINVTGVFIVMQSVANVMVSQTPQGGVIVNTASMAGHGTPPNMIAYASSKAAVIHMTKIAAKDYCQHNIRINSVSPAFIGPGFMWTRQIELQAAAHQKGSQYFADDPVEVAKSMIGETPMKRYGSIDEVMGPVTFLLSDDASYLTGVDIKITGGIM